MIPILAWRNLWRNRRRTWITVTSVAFAVIIVVFSRSATTGVYDKMTDNVVRFATGFIQIHQKGYWDEQIVDNSFELPDDLIETARNEKYVTAVTPRFQAFALASTGDLTSGALILGIDPQQEEQITKIKDKIVAGSYLLADDQAVIIGEGLAQKLKAGVNDTLLFMSQGYHGTGAYGKMTVKGVVRFPSPDLNRVLIWMPLTAAQTMFDAPGRLTALSIMVDNPDHIYPVEKALAGRLDTAAYEVMNWKILLPELDQVIEADRGGHLITASVLYLVVAFGIFGTILMMTAERRREFGILVAIGMKKSKLMLVLVLEILFIALLGVVVGEILAFPVVWWFREHPLQFSGDLAEVYAAYGIEPIMPTVIKFPIFFQQGIIVFCIGMFLAIWPIVTIFRMKEVDAMRG